MRQVILNRSHAGTLQEVDVGDAITVQLEENPSTGYTWELSSCSETVLSRAQDSGAPAASVLPGAARIRTFRVVARSAGTALLELSLHRPWQSQQVAERFTVTIKVR